MSKLAQILNNSWYSLEKIANAVNEDATSDFVAMAQASIPILRKQFQELDSGFQERGRSAIEDYFSHLEYTIDNLDKYFEAVKSGKTPPISQKTAYIFHFYLKGGIEELITIAEDIDAE